MCKVLLWGGFNVHSSLFGEISFEQQLDSFNHGNCIEALNYRRLLINTSCMLFKADYFQHQISSIEDQTINKTFQLYIRTP
ncbi:CLUMA_CG003697, isoform A [Clunio marinus]|uniref:CLUMA_CG003697, isoform A n=1 Tax=Clunio marinus TaxID=568069 RepID=A0A1J1HUY1_9DIPT|nr:CLUMA_CG003697, isoform A [Clunio marinus]